MWLNCLLIVLLHTKYLVHSSDDFDAADSDADAEAEWDSIESDADDDDYESDDPIPRPKSHSEHFSRIHPLRLPESVRIPASKLYKDLFKPERGDIPLPPLLRSILLPGMHHPRPHHSPRTREHKLMEVLCHLDRMYVRVAKSLFAKSHAYKHLKLGTCAVNKATDTHYYFLYHLKGCGIKRGENANHVTFTNTLHYRPHFHGMVVREIPFTVPIRCRYAKFHRSYQTGFLPKILGGTLYRGLHTRLGPALYVVDESWNLLEDDKPSVVIGKPICFEARGPKHATSHHHGHHHHHLYLNSCYATHSPNPFSPVKYPVVENYGCMVDSKHSALTKFFVSPDRSVRFCVAAFLFKSMISKSRKTMYMHCELDMGPETPTPSAKSCTYDTDSKLWTELYGDDSVCECCESTCPNPRMDSDNTMITSKSWDLKLDKEMPMPTETMPEFSSGQDDFELFWELDD